MREREVEARLRRQVEARGGQCLKFVPDQDPGMPDRLILLPHGEVCWVELKKPVGGKVSKLQARQHQRLRRLGHRVEVVWTPQQADALAAELFPGGGE